MKMRRMDRLVSDRAGIGRIIADSAVCRVAVKDEEGLYIVPLSFGYTETDTRRWQRMRSRV